MHSNSTGGKANASLIRLPSASSEVNIKLRVIKIVLIKAHDNAKGLDQEDNVR